MTQQRAVIWDLDGTLVDSTEFHWVSWRTALAAEGFDLTPERYPESFGKRNAEVVRLYLGDTLSDHNAEGISTSKEIHYRTLIHTHGITFLPGAERWLKWLRDQGWKQAVATSAPRENIEVIFAALNLTSFFDTVVGADDVVKGKPNPEVFLTAANRLHLAPTRCIVVEDASAGVEAAQRAGIPCIGVRTTNPALVAPLTITTLDELSEDMFDRLLESSQA